MPSTFFRSEEISLCQIFFPNEVLYSSIAKIGELSCVQFIDMNPQTNVFQRKYVNEVRRCEEMERKLRFFESEVVKESIKLDYDYEDERNVFEAPKMKEMITLESELEKIEHDLREVIANKNALNKNYLELIELSQILESASYFFQEHNQVSARNEASHVLNMNATSFSPTEQSLTLGFLTGILNRDKVSAFELLIWRMCRGNAFLKMHELPEPIEDPQTGEKTWKVVFVIFFQGDQLKSKCKRICDGLKATIYPCPDSEIERSDMLIEVKKRIDELANIISQSDGLRKSLIDNASKCLIKWNCQVKKMKAVFHAMNLFIHDQKRSIAECWIPTDDIGRVREILDGETKSNSSTMQIILNDKLDTTKQRPTYHKLNKFTAGFQNIVNAYGIASYQEINPAIFTIITFPFLFALMFGDAGHALIMIAASYFMIYKEKPMKKQIKGNEVLEILFGGRYIIFLMGLFSVYTGFIYNDTFSKSLNIFGSSWRVNVTAAFPFGDEQSSFYLNPNPLDQVNNRMYSGTPYPVGLDPIWQLSINKITFTNTMKMKISIIIGVSQMLFGLILSLFNILHRKDRLSLYFVFIPQLIFLVCIFGYLCLLIIIKWIKYAGTTDSYTGTCAPNLLIELINMFFLKDSAKNIDGSTDECKRIYSGQVTMQQILVIVSVLCIPVMLLVKPFVLRHRHKNKMNGVNNKNEYQSFTNPVSINSHEDDEENLEAITTVKSNGATKIIFEPEKAENEEEEEEFDFSEIFVEQAIHTIEYFLGCVSHTASYLRLWALSLAHAELSDVLWQRLFRMGLTGSGVVGAFTLVGSFAAWATFTVGILVMMEGLSAFLHALRLHWVEFQSKFYEGNGYEFEPFSFNNILESEEKKDL